MFSRGGALTDAANPKLLVLASWVLGLDRIPGFQVGTPLGGSSWQLVKFPGGNGFKSPEPSRWAITLPID